MQFKRAIVGAIGLFSVCGFAQATAPEMTLDDVIARYVEALGGVEKLHAIKTMRASGAISQDGVDAGHVMQEWKFIGTNHMRMEMEAGNTKSVRVYNGKDGWEFIPQMGQQGPTPMTKDELVYARAESEVLGPLVTYKDRGLTAELLGRVDVDDRECYRIKLNLKDGGTLIEYIDTETFLEPRTETTQHTDAGDIVTNVKLSDYRKVEGLTIPFATDAEVLVPKQPPQRSQFQADKIEVNVEIDDAEFATPPELAPTTKPSK